jgi:hypothetical protein
MELKEVCISRRVDSTDKESVEGDATNMASVLHDANACLVSHCRLLK